MNASAHGLYPVRRYDLYGVINHFGSMAAGHYTAACRVPLGKGKEDWCALLHSRAPFTSISWVVPGQASNFGWSPLQRAPVKVS